jgi:NTP pyrophosphatase (non-canonical NTP hydrolase)
MQATNSRLVLSPSDLNDHVECTHLTTLALEVCRGTRPHPWAPEDHADLLRRKGEEHEAAYLADLRVRGRKNLAAALCVEAAELLEHFQWRTEEESESLPAENLAKVKEEIADVLLYLIRLADKLNVDLLEAATSKLAMNAQKYPVDKARGNSRKYTDF